MLAALRVDRHLAEEERCARVEEVDSAKSSPRARPSHTHPPGLTDARRREAGARELAVHGHGEAAPRARVVERVALPRRPRPAARRVEAVRHVLDERRAAAEGEALDVVRRRRAVAPIDQPLRDDAGRQLGRPTASRRTWSASSARTASRGARA